MFLFSSVAINRIDTCVTAYRNTRLAKWIARKRFEIACAYRDLTLVGLQPDVNQRVFTLLGWTERPTLKPSTHYGISATDFMLVIKFMRRERR